jgi:hypothetical protein
LPLGHISYSEDFTDNLMPVEECMAAFDIIREDQVEARSKPWPPRSK